MAKAKKTKEVVEENKVLVEENKDFFFVGISCGYTFRNLIESLLKFSSSAMFKFTSEGFSYKYIQPDKNFVVSIDFPSSYLNNYLFHGNEEMTICLNMEDFHKKIKDIRVQESIRLFIDPEDPDRKFSFQVCENEEAEIASLRYILPKYVQKIDHEFPQIDRQPDRVISHDTFMKMGETFKVDETQFIFVTKKKFKTETTISFEVKLENKSSGSVNLYSNPGMFQPLDNDEPEISVAKIPKNIFEKFSLGSKFNKDGIVRIYVENEKFVIFELSFSHVGFLRIWVKHVDHK